jgi:hypothetical protein
LKPRDHNWTSPPTPTPKPRFKQRE